MPRQRLSAFAALEVKGTYPNDQAFCAVSDVSLVGIGLKTGQPPSAGQRVVIRLGIEEEILTMTAKVTRVEKRGLNWYLVGLDWSQCSGEQMEFLDRYMAAQDLDDLD